MLSRRVRLAHSLRHALTRPRAYSRPSRCAYASTTATFEASNGSPESIIFQSPHTPVNIPDGTIWEIAKTQASVKGDRNAFICGITQQNVTFDELYQRAKRLAVALAEDGVRKGDAVILHSFNCVEYPMVVLALMALGAVCSPSSPMFRAPELALQAKSANARYIIAHKDLKDVALEAADMVAIQKKHVYTMGEEDAPKLKSVNELSMREYGHFEFEPIDPDSNVLLPFSSGTTGIPKGVALSARNILTNTYQVDHVEKLGDHSLGLLPFFHIYGMMMMHLSIVQATAKVVLPRFEPESLLKTLSTYKVSDNDFADMGIFCLLFQIRTAHIAPPLALFLAHDPLVEKYDLSATEFVVSGGAPVGKELENLVKNRLGMTVKQIYGMTEASPAVNYCEDAFRKPGSVGRLVPNTELRVRCTSTGVDLPANARGELLYRGPQVMLGYLNNPDANNSVFTEDRFLCSGDIGYVDDDGFVFVVDRVKELIKYKGHQVAPAELEDILKHHPAIVDSCCVRGRDSDGQEVPKAYVALKDKSNAAKITAEEIMEFVAERVAPFKKVRQVEFTDAIPKSPTGKTLRRQLQEIENQKHSA